MRDQDEIRRRIESMARELAALKARLEPPRGSAGSTDRDDLERKLYEQDVVEGRLEAPTSELMARAEMLFDALVHKRCLASYGKTYELLFNEAPWPFRNAVHVPRVLSVATRTSPRTIDGLEARLDSLIVAIRGRVPGPGHFRTAKYTADEWRRVFGPWGLMK